MGGGYPKFGVIPLRKDEINKLYPNLSILRKHLIGDQKLD